MDQDRNLLFGVFAVQLKRVSASEIMSAAAAWAAEPSQPLAERLVANRALSEDDCKFLDRLVNEAVESHDGDAAATLAALGGAHLVEDTFARTIVLTDSGEVKVRPGGKDGEESPSKIEAIDEPDGRYVNEIEHARGGMGRVLFVHDSFLERDIALKEIRPPSNFDDESTDKAHGSGSLLNRFLREAKITGQLEHPSIVPVYELGHRQDGTLYYTMKLVRGRTLSAAFKDAQDLDERLHLLPHFVNLCQAIAYAHSRKVIHRDIKPANVMIGEFGETVVIDWGLAKVKDHEDDFHVDPLGETVRVLRSGDDTPMTAYGEVMGTPAYMPPEQAKGQLDQIDERSDLYSLGAVLYELLTGVPPYSGKTTAEILAKVVDAKPAPISSHAGNAPSELVAICMRAISAHPHDRYNSVMELADEIRRFQTGSFVQAYRYNFSDYVARYVKRNSTFVATAATAIIIVIGITAYFTLQMVQTNTELSFSNQELALASEEAQRSQEQAIQRREEAERQSYFTGLLLARTLIDDREFEEARVALESTPAGLRGWEWGYLANRSNAHTKAFTGKTGNMADAYLSPDGQRVTTVERDASVTSWDVQTGEALESIDSDDYDLTQVVGSPENYRVATLVEMPGVTSQVWDTRTGQMLGTFGTLERPAIDEGAFSPDAKQIVTISVNDTAVIWDLETFGERHVLKGQGYTIEDVAWSPDGRVVATSGGKHVTLWDAETGEILHSLDERPEPVDTIWFTADSQSLAMFHEARVIAKVDTATGSKEQTFLQLQAPITARQNLDDGIHMLTGSTDGILRLWDVQKGTRRQAYVGHTAPILDVDVSPDSTLLASVSRDRTVKLWDRHTSELLHTFEGHSDAVRSVQFSEDGRSIITASSDGSARIWSTYPNRHRTRDPISAHDGRARGMHWQEDGSRFVTFGDDSAVVTWNVDTLDRESVLCDVCRFGADEGTVSHDGNVLALVCSTEAVLFNLENPENPRTIAGSFAGASFSPTDDRLLCVNYNGSAQIFDVETGDQLLELEGDEETFVWQAFFAPDGDSFVTVSEEPGVKRWDAHTGELLTNYEGHTGIVMRGTFNADGTRLLTASSDRSAILWDVDSGLPVHVLSDHPASVTAVAFHPDGNRMATSTKDGDIHIWNPEDGANLAVFSVRKELQEDSPKVPVEIMRWSPDGRTLGLGFSDGIMTILHALPWSESLQNIVIDAAPHAPTPSPLQIEAIASAPRAIYRLQALHDLATREQAFENYGAHLIVDESPSARSLLRIGIMAGDRIMSIDGQPLTELNADEHISNLIKGFRNGTSSGHVLELNRRGIPIRIRMRYIEPIQEEKVIHMAPKDAASIIAALSIGIKQYRGVFRDMQHLSAARGMGLYLEGDRLAGTLVADFPAPTAQGEMFKNMLFSIMERLGMSKGYRIIAINGHYVDSIQDIEALAISMTSETRKPTGGRIVLDTESGSYRQTRITLELDQKPE